MSKQLGSTLPPLTATSNTSINPPMNSVEEQDDEDHGYEPEGQLETDP
jgi:hypothetical protein